MTPYTLLGALGTVVVGGGVAAGCGFAFKPSSKNDGLESLIAPPQQVHLNNYLVVAQKKKPLDTNIKQRCSLLDDCRLFDSKSKEPIALEDLSEIRSGNRYVFNIDQHLLQPYYWVEVKDKSDKKLWFVVQSNATKEKTINIKPTPPSGLLEKAQLFSAIKTCDVSDQQCVNNQAVIKSQRYYNNQIDSFIPRKKINHDSFFIFKWGAPDDELKFYVDKTDNSNVDKYIFKTIAEQKAESSSIGQLLIETGSASPNIFMEIYEIKNQTLLTNTFAGLTTSKEMTNVDWTTLAQENVMITKLSELEVGKYYKFVVSDFSKLSKELNSNFIKFEVKQKITDTYNRRLLYKKLYNKTDNYCIKYPSASTDATSKCIKKQS